MMSVPDPRPTLSELNEFRNALAGAHAGYHQDQKEASIVTQLIENPYEHVIALKSLVLMLLAELDGAKRDADVVLHEAMNQAAVTDTRPVRR
jgi:hypothetical protein